MATVEADRLRSIKHIVVLMMENRSFDQMLGYLHRDGMPDVDGLTGDESNDDPEGNPHRVFELGPGQLAFHRPDLPFDKLLDPCHSPTCVSEQVANGTNGGFVKNFLTTRGDVPTEWRALPMGYYTGEQLPVYDHLARNYCVCDRWHSSIPGDTWPNRLYALSGGAGPRVKLKALERLRLALSRFRLPSPPLYDIKAFTRHLGDPQWRWYSHDPATLRLADGQYRNFRHPQQDNFTYFDRRRVALATQVAESPFVARDSFLDDAAKGELRDVSWIDPNFVDLHVFDPDSNDDHPPSDVGAGQALVLELYEALVNSPAWEDTLLVVLYDEHGGFYDHVAPPAVDDGSGHRTLGLRVPALVVGPRVKRFVCHEVFDHTSLIKTILSRFAPDPAAAIAAMGPRVRAARDLGAVLDDAPRTDLPAPGALRAQVEARRQEARRLRAAAPGAVAPAPDGAGHRPEFTDLQTDLLHFSRAARALGLPSGQP